MKGTMDEFAFAISTVHFRTLRKWIKAISEVQADWATANTSPRGRDDSLKKPVGLGLGDHVIYMPCMCVCVFHHHVLFRAVLS